MTGKQLTQIFSVTMNTYITLSLGERSSDANTSPEIYAYLPQVTSQPSKAVIICGGGGFNKVNIDHEGHQFAEWLSSIGVTGIVLNYRLPHGDKNVTETDLRLAVELVRRKSTEWNIDPNQIGAAGFSIGGHAVSILATREEKESKLDFSMLFYSVVDMSDQLTHKPSRDKLLGSNPSNEDLEYYSSLNHVSDTTPKCLIMACNDDNVVSPLNSVEYYRKLKQYNIPATLFIFESGGHGWGMKKDFPFHHEMLSLVEKWLKD